MKRTHAFTACLSAVIAISGLAAGAHSQTSSTAAKVKPDVPVTMTECEGVNDCATWTFLGAQGNGQWPSGEIANLTVESLDKDTVVIHRADSTGASAGLTAVYKGTRHDDRIGGEFTSSWPGHWTSKAGNWYANIGKVSQAPPSVMHWCAAFCRTWIWVNGHYQVLGDTGPSQIVTVESWTRDSVVMHRTDTGQYPGTAVLTGQISNAGNSIDNGTITWTFHPCCGLTSGKFNATWGSAMNNLPGADPVPPTVVVAPVVCYAWFLGLVCSH
jgi:hypothetical protein